MVRHSDDTAEGNTVADFVIPRLVNVKRFKFKKFPDLLKKKKKSNNKLMDNVSV